MNADAAAIPVGSRILYPSLPVPLTPADLKRWFSPGHSDRQWAFAVARTPRSELAMLVQLLIFRAVGRFLSAEEIPAAIVEFVAREIKAPFKIPFRLTDSKYSQRTWYRHQDAILTYLNITPWDDRARLLAESTMMKIGAARTDPADLINAAIDALVRHRFELPALVTLRRMAGSAHHAVNEGQWRQVCALLTDQKRGELEAILTRGTGCARVAVRPAVQWRRAGYAQEPQSPDRTL